MPSIQSLTMTYDALNESGTFSEGDALTGKVTLVLLKATTVESLFVKAKGDAEVRWTKKSGDRTYTYSSHKRYFKLKQFLIPEETKDTAVSSGTHVYPFRFHIPPGSMPSSFRGRYGKIVYSLEAKLSRSWRIDRTVEKEINFVSKSFQNLQSLMSRHIGSTSKEMGFFSRGSVHMDVIVDKRAYAPGETIAIVARVNNSSSSEMTPKFSLVQDIVYRAQGNTKHEGTVISRVVDNSIKPQTRMDVKCALQIPRVLLQTIQNCDIISVVYHLRVYLDISFATDPEVKFPVVIFPSDLAPGVAAGPNPAGAFGGPSNSDFAPPAVAMGPYPAGAFGRPTNSHYPPSPVFMGPFSASPRSGRYGQPAAQSYSAPPPQYPAQPAYASGGYNNPVPQPPTLYGDPLSSMSPVLHPPPTAPVFPPPPSGPQIQPSPLSSPFNVSPSAPTYNLLPSAPAMNTDFLSQTDEAPPAYSVLFPSSATEEPDAK